MESGAYYEAQQMYKTSYHRCKSRGQVMESYQILQVPGGGAGGGMSCRDGVCTWRPYAPAQREGNKVLARGEGPPA